MLYYVLSWISYIYTVVLILLVIEIRDNTDMSVSENVPVYFGFAYQHFYTGALMSERYQSNKREKYKDGIRYRMAFGGLPSYTYTTISLHSSPNRLQGMELYMFRSRRPYAKFLGFSSELHSPISIFTEYDDAVKAENYDYLLSDDETTYPTFLFSFKGKYTVKH